MRFKSYFNSIILAIVASTHPVAAQPTLNITAAGGHSVLSWPTNAGSYFLESSTNLASMNWLAFSNSTPVLFGSNLTVTITNSSKAMFFRLRQDTNMPSDFDGMVLIPSGDF